MQQLGGEQPGLAVPPASPAFRERRGWREAWRQIKRDRFLYALAALPLLYFVIFQYLPMAGVIIAFQDYDPFLGLYDMFRLDRWVGLKHFRNFFDSIFFWNVMRNTVVISLYKLVFGFPLPIILALLINELRMRVFQRTVQTISYLPHFFSMVVAAGIVRAMLTPQGGLLNQLVVSLGGEPKAYLTDPDLFRSIIVTMDVWQHAGWNSIIYLAAMATINPEMYEAAAMDGANRFHRMWHVTLPSIAFAIVITLIFRIGGMLNAGFEQILLLYSPSTYSVSDIIDTYVYRAGLIGRQYSFGAAVGLFKSLLAFIMMYIANKIAHNLGKRDSGRIAAMKYSRREKIFDWINIIFLTLITLLFLLPFLSVVSTSLISGREYALRGLFILYPQKPVLTSYHLLLGQGSLVLNSYVVTFARVTIGTGLNLLLTFPLAYVLSKRMLYGRVPITMLIFFTMLFHGGLIPNFILVEKLNLLNSFWSMILPPLINPWWLLIMRNFMLAIPDELEEAAIMDGANPLTVLLRVYLPLSMPVIATIGLWYAVFHWNSWFDAAIYLNTPSKFPLQLVLRGFLEFGTGQYGDTSGLGEMTELIDPPPAESLKAAMIVVTTLPILMVYPFLQRYFVKGIMLGSIKG